MWVKLVKRIAERLRQQMDNKGDDGGLPLCRVLPFILVISPVQLESGGAAQGLPTKAFQSRQGSISSPNLLCSSVHLQLSHWSLTGAPFTRTPKVDNVMREGLCSSLVFTGVLSPLPSSLSTKQVIVPRWLRETPLISVASCLRWITGCYLEQDNYLPLIHYSDLNYSSGIIYLV